MKIDALILAGGQGRRMGGVDKGLQLYRGRALVDWVLEAAQNLDLNQVLISANRNIDVYLARGVPVIADQVPGFKGPLAGIEAGLSHTGADALLVLPCDIPNWPADLLARLSAALEGKAMAVARAGGQHSLISLIRPSVLAQLREHLAQGQNRFVDWLIAEDAALVDFPVGSFANMNTPEDLVDGLTHFNAAGEAHMVDVGSKRETRRLARASGLIRMKPTTLALIAEGNHEKGDVLGVARIAGIMAAKKTSDLIPLCHPLPLTHLDVSFVLDAAVSAVRCTVVAETLGRTGVEMEALTAVNVALLTIYDMCKAVDRGMEMGAIRLEEKQGGKSGFWCREAIN